MKVATKKAILMQSFSFENSPRVLLSPFQKGTRLTPPLSFTSSLSFSSPSSLSSVSHSIFNISPSLATSSDSSTSVSLGSSSLLPFLTNITLFLPMDFLRPMQACSGCKWVDDTFFHLNKEFLGESCSRCHAVFRRDRTNMEQFIIHVLTKICTPASVSLSSAVSQSTSNLSNTPKSNNSSSFSPMTSAPTPTASTSTSTSYPSLILSGIDRPFAKSRALGAISQKMVDVAYEVPFSFCESWWPIHRVAWIRTVCRSATVVDFRSILLFFAGSLSPRIFKKKWTQWTDDLDVFPFEEGEEWDEVVEDDGKDDKENNQTKRKEGDEEAEEEEGERRRGGEEMEVGRSDQEEDVGSLVKESAEQRWKKAVGSISSLAQLSFCFRLLLVHLRWDAVLREKEGLATNVGGAGGSSFHHAVSIDRTGTYYQDKILKKKVELSGTYYLVRWRNGSGQSLSAMTTWVSAHEVGLQLIQDYERRVRGGQKNTVNGVTCHQCHIKRDFRVMNYCGSCVLKFCDRCLVRKYGKPFFDSVKKLGKEEWKCPKCNGMCVCSQCVQRREGKGGRRKSG